MFCSEAAKKQRIGNLEWRDGDRDKCALRRQGGYRVRILVRFCWFFQGSCLSASFISFCVLRQH